MVWTPEQDKGEIALCSSHMIIGWNPPFSSNINRSSRVTDLSMISVTLGASARALADANGWYTAGAISYYTYPSLYSQLDGCSSVNSNKSAHQNKKGNILSLKNMENPACYIISIKHHLWNAIYRLLISLHGWDAAKRSWPIPAAVCILNGQGVDLTQLFPKHIAPEKNRPLRDTPLLLCVHKPLKEELFISFFSKREKLLFCCWRGSMTRGMVTTPPPQRAVLYSSAVGLPYSIVPVWAQVSEWWGITFIIFRERVSILNRNQ